MATEALPTSDGPHPLIARLHGGLIVSCQALPGEPLHTASGGVMALMAKAAAAGGAVAIRANGARDIAEIKAAVDLPIIGLVKRSYPPFEPYITATSREVEELMQVDADVIALDCTNRDRPDGLAPAERIAQLVRDYPTQLFMADVSTYEEGMEAARAGAHLIGTTLDGYTSYTSESSTKPDADLVARLARDSGAPIVAEGAIHYPWQAQEMLAAGAWSVVVGGAITRPLEITARFVQAMQATNDRPNTKPSRQVKEDYR